MTEHELVEGRSVSFVDRIISFHPKHIYAYLFFTLMLLLFFFPLLHNLHPVLDFLFNVFLIATLLTGVLAASRHHIQFLISVIIAVIVLTSSTASEVFDHQWLSITTLLFGAAFFILILIDVVIDVYYSMSRVTGDTIFGAISVYLMFGLIFAFIFQLFYVIVPGSFELPEKMVQTTNDIFPTFIYYSFVTMTTLGYGDITPQSPEAGVITYMAALTGQIYLVVMIAYIVGTYVSQHRR